MRAIHQLSDDTALCAWLVNVSPNNTTYAALDWGIIQGSTVTSWLGESGPTPPADCTVEVAFNGSAAELRYWDAQAGARPDTAQYTHAAPALSADAVGFSTIGSTAQTIKSVTVS